MNLRYRPFVLVTAINNKQLEMRSCIGTRRDEGEIQVKEPLAWGDYCMRGISKDQCGERRNEA